MKRCPRCSNLVFDEMNQCFECMYVFVSEESQNSEEINHHAASATVKEDLTNVSAPHLPSGFLSEHTMSNERLDKTEDEVEGEIEDIEDVTQIEDGSKFFLELYDLSGFVQKFELSEKGLKLGRSKHADIMLQDPTVSRDHLRIYLNGTKVFAEDRNASNPSYLEGLPLRGCVEIENGTEIKIRSYTLILKTL